MNRAFHAAMAEAETKARKSLTDNGCQDLPPRATPEILTPSQDATRDSVIDAAASEALPVLKFNDAGEVVEDVATRAFAILGLVRVRGHTILQGIIGALQNGGPAKDAEAGPQMSQRTEVHPHPLQTHRFAR